MSVQSLIFEEKKLNVEVDLLPKVWLLHRFDSIDLMVLTVTDAEK